MSRADPSDSQDRLSVARNRAFFEANEGYAKHVATLRTYQNIRNAVDRAIAGRRRLLDVGNGGVFDYDMGLVPEIVGVDLFRDQTIAEQLPAHVTLRCGNALELPERDASFDAVLCVFLFHHLVATEVNGTIGNIRSAVREARRVLEPGGRFIVVESCVPPWAFALERRLFGVALSLAHMRLMKHPPTLQFPQGVVEGILREQFANVYLSSIPVGPVILQFGHRWPVALTPARPYLFIAD